MTRTWSGYVEFKGYGEGVTVEAIDVVASTYDEAVRAVIDTLAQDYEEGGVVLGVEETYNRIWTL